MVRECAFVRQATPPRVRHHSGLPGSPDSQDLPRPSLALLEERSDGFFLIRLTFDGIFCGDTWHMTAEEARGQAEFEFDLVGPWLDIPDDVDPTEYAIQASGGIGHPD
jgi:hypothetical protein